MSLIKLFFLISLFSFSFRVCSETGAFGQTSPSVQVSSKKEWRFAVSGDSRNCGDVVMPTMAQDVNRQNVNFYWHLGDFRAIYDFDQDMQPRAASSPLKPLTIIRYEEQAWSDFIDNQIAPFSVPVFLDIGNHETIPPKTRAEYIAQFADWLNAPIIKEQRLSDNPRDHRLKTYYHWIQNGIDFINLDNASADQFDNEQLKWVEAVLARDEANASVNTIIVGMHAALPDSIAADHSMNNWATGEQSGRQLYADLLNVQNRGHKRVYLLASHSHFFMDGIFNTEYLKTHGGVLPGWIIGTAGAVRYKLPAGANQARAAQTNVYGYLLATVNPANEAAGTVRFEFRQVQESNVPPSVVARVGQETVHQCFEKNSEAH